jgi:hypothetical protein
MEDFRSHRSTNGVGRVGPCLVDALMACSRTDEKEASTARTPQTDRTHAPLTPSPCSAACRSGAGSGRRRGGLPGQSGRPARRHPCARGCFPPSPSPSSPPPLGWCVCAIGKGTGGKQSGWTVGVLPESMYHIESVDTYLAPCPSSPGARGPAEPVVYFCLLFLCGGRGDGWKRMGVSQSVCQSVCQSVSQPVSQSLTQPVSQSVSQSVSQMNVCKAGVKKMNDVDQVRTDQNLAVLDEAAMHLLDHVLRLLRGPEPQEPEAFVGVGGWVGGSVGGRRVKQRPRSTG